MISPQRIPGNPLRQLLVGLPLGLLATSAVFDLIALRTGAAPWWSGSWAALYAGVTLAVISYPLTLVDVLALRSHPRLMWLRRLHEGFHGAAVLLFLGTWLLRDIQQAVGSTSLQLSAAGAACAVAAAWIGDELVVQMRSLRERRRGAGRPTRYAHHRP